MNLSEIRQKYPQYAKLSDQQLADGLYNKFYAGKMDRAAFDKAIGFTAPATASPAAAKPAPVSKPGPPPESPPTATPAKKNPGFDIGAVGKAVKEGFGDSPLVSGGPDSALSEDDVKKLTAAHIFGPNILQQSMESLITLGATAGSVSSRTFRAALSGFKELITQGAKAAGADEGRADYIGREAAGAVEFAVNQSMAKGGGAITEAGTAKAVKKGTLATIQKEFNKTEERGSKTIKGVPLGIEEDAAAKEAAAKTINNEPVKTDEGQPSSPTSAQPPAEEASPRTPTPAVASHNAAIGTLRAIKSVFSAPKVGVGGPEAAALIRREVGLGNREARSIEAGFDPFVKQFNQADEATRMDVIDYIENRSTGATLGNTAFQGGADAIKKVYDDFQAQLSALPRHAQMGFVDDYFTHLWKDPHAAQAVAEKGYGKFGTGRFTKARKIPTVADGLAAGLELRNSNPLDAVMSYTEGMSRYLAKERVLDTAKANGSIKFYAPGKAPRGLLPLMEAYRGGKQAYADADFARIYNNFISRGWHSTPEGGAIYDALESMTMATSKFVLALSGYHAFNIAATSMFDSLGRAVGEIAKGKPVTGIKTALKAFGAPVTYALTGKKLTNEYLGISKNGPKFARIADLAAKANARVADRNLDFRATAAGSYIKAFKQGALKGQFKSDIKEFQANPIKAALPLAFKQLGRVADTTSAWLFDHYIPAVKNGAFYNNMSSWLDNHPNATAAEAEAAARTITDSVDNRFGEMMRDNLFWNKAVSQTAQLLMLSPTWSLGIIRELGGGVIDLGKSAKNLDELTTRSTYIGGFVIGTVLLNSVAQYLFTGQGPQSIQDILAPKTGGKNPDGSPERMILPGHEKDVVGFSTNPVQEAKNKISPFWSIAKQILTASDWTGRSLNPTGTFAGLMRAEGQILLNNLPISVQNLQQATPGSKLGPISRMLGLRGAPGSIGEPERGRFFEASKAVKDLQTKIYSDMFKLKADPGNVGLAKQIQQEKEDLQLLIAKKNESAKSYKGITQ